MPPTDKKQLVLSLSTEEYSRLNRALERYNEDTNHIPERFPARFAKYVLLNAIKADEARSDD